MVYICHQVSLEHGHNSGRDERTMETLSFKFKANQPVNHQIHLGVVSSGDLEILLTPSKLEGETTVSIVTGSDGFKTVWENVLTRFFTRYPIAVHMEINDFGATPGVVYLRLTQVLEELQNEE